MKGGGRGTKMRPIRSTIPIDEALAIVEGAARPIERTERVGLAEASGRVLASAIVSGRDVPPFDRAAMDGYAVRAADTAGAGPDSPTTFRLIETVHTGRLPSREVIARGGSIAALGVAEVDVYDRPRVGLLSTGDEIVEPGEPLAPGQIYDVNRYTMAAVIAAHGGRATIHPITGDSVAALGAAVEAIIDAGADILVFSGGSSVGERDLTLDVMRERGEVLFHGIAVKPGKPTAFGRIGATPVFGMPGYPTSCLSNAYLLLLPFLRRTARLRPHAARTVRAPAAHRFASPANRHQFYTVRLVDGAAVGAFKASGDITSMSQADGYIEIPIGVGAIDAGTTVDVTLF